MSIFKTESITVTRISIDGDEVKKIIGAALREVRHQRGLTQEQAAAMIDVSRTQLTNVELGRSFLSAESLCLAIVNFDLCLDRKFFGEQP